MLSDWIDIFDGDKIAGSVEVEIDLPVTSTSLTRFIEVELNGKTVTILHIIGLSYGILIPEHIAEEMKEANKNE